MAKLGSDDYNVVVIGAGNAALTAALAAKEAGARVVVLEKAPEPLCGGNTRFSGGLLRFAYDGIQDVKELMPHVPPADLERVSVGQYGTQDFYDDVMRISAGEADPTLSHLMVDESLPTMHWMRQMGVAWEFTTLWTVELEGKTTFTSGSLLQARGKGAGLSQMLFGAVARHDIPVLYQAKFQQFLLDGQGAIRGLVVRTPEGIRELACQAAVLASGGFEANAEMRARYLGGNWDRAKVRGTKYNTGEGLMAALAIGAKPVGHWRGCHATPIDAGAPEFGELALSDLTNRLSYLFGITVNVHSQRFADEGEDFGGYTYAKTGGAILDQPRSRAYQIFDQQTVGLLERRYETGEPTVADNLEDLARRLDLDSGALAKTVHEYNSALSGHPFNPLVLDGKSTQGIVPPKSNWATRIDQPPYVAYPVTGGITFTFGGVEIDSQARVLDTEDQPIPGLYATGELTGKFFYHNYPGGTGLMRGAVFGRIAGGEAARYVR